MISFVFRNLADTDKDGRLTPDEFVLAMHCCDIVRSGQTLPSRLPDDWLKGTQIQRDRIGSVSKTNGNQVFANLNQELRDTFGNSSPETVELERKNSIVTYEEKRQKNYEVCISNKTYLMNKNLLSCLKSIGWL